MKLTEITVLFEYNYWANRRIVGAAEQATLEQRAQHTSLPFGSLHGTLIHLLDAERSWRELLQNNRMTFEWTEADFPTLESLQARWAVEEAAMRAYIKGLTDEQLVGIIQYTTPEGAERRRILWHCLYHVVNHATQHRSEAGAMLTDFGHSPGDLDFTLFLNENPGLVQI